MTIIDNYKCAKTFRDKVKCLIAKFLGAKVVTPLGRIVLLPKDYARKIESEGT